MAHSSAFYSAVFACFCHLDKKNHVHSDTNFFHSLYVKVISLVVFLFFIYSNIETRLVQQCTVFAIYMSEKLNDWGAEHWQKFSGQKYFDPHGAFITVVYAGPLLLISLVILVHNIYGQSINQFILCSCGALFFFNIVHIPPQNIHSFFPSYYWKINYQVNFVVMNAKLLIAVKRAEIRFKQQQQQQQSQSADKKVQ